MQCRRHKPGEQWLGIEKTVLAGWKTRMAKLCNCGRPADGRGSGQISIELKRMTTPCERPEGDRGPCSINLIETRIITAWHASTTEVKEWLAGN